MANNFVSNANATDLMNAINQKKDTKPDTITWDEWIALTDEQREGTHYIITNVPASFSSKDAVFALRNVTLEFTNKTAVITDARVTPDAYLFTFFYNETVAQAAGIECTWGNGTITFTVDENPTSDIILDILAILPALATPSKDVSADDVSYDNTDSGLTATNAQDAIDEVNSSKVSKSGDTMSGHLTIDLHDGGADQSNTWSSVVLGNNISKGTAGHSAGYVRFFGHGSNYTDLSAPNATNNRDITLPDKGGTIALTSDITNVGTSAKFVNLYVLGTSSLIIDVVQEVLNAITTDNKVCIVNAIHQYSGIRYLNGYIYANKSYGSFMLQTYYKDTYICSIENGTISYTKIV